MFSSRDRDALKISEFLETKEMTKNSRLFCLAYLSEDVHFLSLLLAVFILLSTIEH